MEMRVVLVSGYFDPIHRGHIYHFRDAKVLGDKLVAFIHRDECCIKKKGYVFMPLEDRLEVLKAIRYVDEVVVCSEGCDLTATQILRKLKPAIFAKGGDRTPETMPREELKACEELGIKIVYNVGGGKIQSSSQLVDRVKTSCESSVAR